MRPPPESCTPAPTTATRSCSRPPRPPWKRSMSPGSMRASSVTAATSLPASPGLWPPRTWRRRSTRWGRWSSASSVSRAPATSKISWPPTRPSTTGCWSSCCAAASSPCPVVAGTSPPPIPTPTSPPPSRPSRARWPRPSKTGGRRSLSAEAAPPSPARDQGPSARVGAAGAGGSGLFAGDLRRQVREDPADDLLVDVLGVVEGGQAPAVLGIGQHAQWLQLQDPEPQAAQVLVIAAVGLIGLHRGGAHALRGVLAVDGHQRPRHLQHQGLVEQFQLDQPAAQLLGARGPQLEVLIGAERHVTGVLDGGERLRGTHQVDAAGDDGAVVEHVHPVALIGQVPQQHIGLPRRAHQALVEIAGEVAGHHAALEVGVDPDVGGDMAEASWSAESRDWRAM